MKKKKPKVIETPNGIKWKLDGGVIADQVMKEYMKTVKKVNGSDGK